MFKARIMFAKQGTARFISHLDLMRALQRAIARAGLPVWYTEGFNPHSYISIALPLSTGYSSQCEFLDLQFTSEEIPMDCVARLNAVMPQGLQVLDVYTQAAPVRQIEYALFAILLDFDSGVPADYVTQATELFERPEIRLVKKSKRKEEEVNIQDFIESISFEQSSDTEVRAVAKLKAGNVSLSPEYVAKALLQTLPAYDGIRFHRLEVYGQDGTIFR